MRVRDLEVYYVIIPMMNAIFGQHIEDQQLYRGKKKDYLKPDFEGAPSQEQLMQQGLIPLEHMEEYIPLLAEIAQETGIPSEIFNKIKSRLFLNPFLHIFQPNALGGFHTEYKFIQFNQKVLADPSAKYMIAHVFFHEYLHMTGVMDEAITEMMTIRKMKETYGRIGFTSGYVGIVEELEDLLGDKSFDELFDLMNRSDSNKLNSIVAEIVLKDAFAGNDLMSSLKLSNLLESARIKWYYIMKLFPRLANEIQGREVDNFTPAIMDWYSVNKQFIQLTIQEQLLLDPIRSYEFLKYVFEKLSEDQRIELYSNPEYSYIFEIGIDLFTYYRSLKKQIENGYEM